MASMALSIVTRYDITVCFTIQNEIYTYPDLWVCLHNTYGCDKYEYEEQCLSSIFDTEGGNTSAEYRPGDVNETTIEFTANITEKVRIHVSTFVS